MSYNADIRWNSGYSVVHAVLAKLVNFLAWTTARESVDYVHVALAGKIAFLQIIQNYPNNFVHNDLI